jgi:AraC-like DNA-binding protein
MPSPQFEIITAPPDSSFKVYQYQQDAFYTPWHFHPEYELTYIVSSQGMRYVGANVEHFEEHDLVLLGPRLPHCWKNTEKRHRKAKSIVIQWNEDILGEGWLDKSEFIPIQQLYQRSNRGIKFERQVAYKIRPHLDNLLVQSPFNKLMQLIYILHQLAYTNEFDLLLDEEYVHDLSSKDNDRINNAYNYVRNNYNNSVSLEEAASLASMSEEAFCRFFSRKTGKTFITFVNEYKINLVCQRLIKTDEQIARAAYECGYNSLPFFYRQFKKFKHCTPSEFRVGYQKAFQGYSETT